MANYFFNDFAYGGLFLIALEMAGFVQSKNIWAFVAVLFLIALQDLLFLIALRGVVNIFDCTKVNFIFFDCTQPKSVCFDYTPQNGIFLKNMFPRFNVRAECVRKVPGTIGMMCGG